MKRAFEKSLWWWGGLVLRCILLAFPIRSRWLKYFSNSFCSQQIWFCALKGFTRKNLKFNCSNLSWLDIVKNMNKFQCHGNLFVGRQMKKQFANRNRSLNSFIYLWTLIHYSSFRAINQCFVLVNPEVEDLLARVENTKCLVRFHIFPKLQTYDYNHDNHNNINN